MTEEIHPILTYGVEIIHLGPKDRILGGVIMIYYINKNMKRHYPSSKVLDMGALLISAVVTWEPHVGRTLVVPSPQFCVKLKRSAVYS